MGKLTELLALVLLHRYCKSFNVLPSGLNRRAASVSGQPCKVTAFFLSGQIFRRKNFQNPEPSGNPACYTLRCICAHAWPAAGHPPASVSFPKAGAKLQLSSLPTKFSENFFSGKISQPHRHYERILLLIKILHPIIFSRLGVRIQKSVTLHPPACIATLTISQPHHQPTKYSTLHSDKHNKRIKYDLWKFQTQHVAPSATPKQATDNVFSLIFIIFATTTKHGLTITTNKAKLLATRHHGTRPHRYRHRTKGCPPRARRQHTTTVYKGLSTPT